MKQIAKLYNLFYTLYLKLFMRGRIRIEGGIASNGFWRIEAGRGAFLHIGRGVTLQDGCFIGVRKNARLEIGDGVFMNRHCSVIVREHVTIGSDTLCGESVKIYDNNHRIENGRVSKTLYDTAPVRVGAECWLGNDVNVLMGSVIPDNTVIAAKGIVKGPLEKSGLYAGIPVQFKKSLL